MNTKSISYDMSIGELLFMYVDGNLNLINNQSPYYLQMNPDLQERIISDLKSGIPLPFSIIADYNENGKWDVACCAEVLKVIFDYMITPEWEKIITTQKLDFKRNKLRVSIVYRKNQG